MMKLISEHHFLTAKLETAIRESDLEVVQILDQKILANWELLMEYDPLEKADRRILIEFYLDEMTRLPNKGKTVQEIKQKILKLL